MSTQEIVTLYPILPTQVWGRLSADRQAQAVRLMAQLALNCVTVQFTPQRKEGGHARPIRSLQSGS